MVIPSTGTGGVSAESHRGIGLHDVHPALEWEARMGLGNLEFLEKATWSSLDVQNYETLKTVDDDMLNFLESNVQAASFESKDQSFVDMLSSCCFNVDHFASGTYGIPDPT